uniref:Uncharacterized protein n=1 Tax=Solanum lycopersicum TaxID=4081 RepID=A0A3Q7H8A7_SOLLC
MCCCSPTVVPSFCFGLSCVKILECECTWLILFSSQFANADGCLFYHLKLSYMLA